MIFSEPDSGMIIAEMAGAGSRPGLLAQLMAAVLESREKSVNMIQSLSMKTLPWSFSSDNVRRNIDPTSQVDRVLKRGLHIFLAQ
jgi:hypothetical protein